MKKEASTDGIIEIITNVVPDDPPEAASFAAPAAGAGAGLAGAALGISAAPASIASKAITAIMHMMALIPCKKVKKQTRPKPILSSKQKQHLFTDSPIDQPLDGEIAHFYR